jgi:RNA polymerase sigma factor (sigma-70 family)
MRTDGQTPQGNGSTDSDFRMKLEEYRPAMIQSAKRITHNQEQAEDAVHDVIEHLLKTQEGQVLKDEANTTVAYVRAFLCKAAARKALDLVKERRLIVEQGSNDYEWNVNKQIVALPAQPDTIAIKNNLLNILADALDSLDDADYLLIYLRHWENHTFVEIGLFLTRHSSSVKRHHDRILKRLRKILVKSMDQLIDNTGVPRS